MEQADKLPLYFYISSFHEDEEALCSLERRALFGSRADDRYWLSTTAVDPSRSPFIKLRIAVAFAAESLELLAKQAETVQLGGATFKLVFAGGEVAAGYDERRAIEREIGWHIRGKAEMRTPEKLFGIARAGGNWLFGECRHNEAVWLQHKEKPQQYSTALPTRAARAIANLAAPDPAGRTVIDPCCGIGTVVIEAMSMGIDIVGYDLNPLAVRGARLNLAHFGLPDVVRLGDLRRLTGSYDAAVVDLPYNLCSVLPPDERLELLAGARRLARRAVVVTTEDIAGELADAGFVVMDGCVLKKGAFTRQILLCE